MYGLLLVLHILVCFALVVVILLQSGKGGGLAGGAFGGTAQTVFGGRGATDFLTRATMVLAGTFFLSSIVLALLSSGLRGPTRSLIQEQARQAFPTSPQGGAPAPGTPATNPSAGAPNPSAPPASTPASPQPAGTRPPTSTAGK